MAIKIGINGFGRIGRMVMRLSQSDPEVQVVQVNDLSPPQTLAHMLKHDAIHGPYTHPVAANEIGMVVADQKIVCSSGPEPKAIDWSLGGVDMVLECSGKFRTRQECEDHMASGPKKVVISAPGKDSDVTVVVGVNQKELKPEHRIISNASCTTNCLAPVAKVLHDNLGILRGYMTTVHSYTNDQRLLCGAHRDLRRARSAGMNMIPTTTGATKALASVLPELAGKLHGISVRVPTPNVSLIDLVVEVKKSTSIQGSNQLFREAAQGSMKGILDFSEEPLVSGDYNGSTFSAVIDGLSTDLLEGNLLKVLAWYDNETAFSQRMIELAKLAA